MADVNKDINIRIKESGVDKLVNAFNNMQKTLNKVLGTTASIEDMVGRKMARAVKATNTELISTSKIMKDLHREMNLLEKKFTAFDKIEKASSRTQLKSLSQSIRSGSVLGTVRDTASSVFERVRIERAKTAATKLVAKGNFSGADAVMGSATSAVGTFATVAGIATEVLSAYASVVKSATGVTLSLKENLNDLVTNIGSILNAKSGAGTYMSGSTLFSNAMARQQQMRYGLSNAQNYALSQSMSLLGMSGEEDLMYMNSKQRQAFTRFMDRYSSWYEKMESSGVFERVQEMQLDIEMMKQEITMDFMEWFAENKDTILGAIKVTANAVLTIAKVVGGAFSWVGKGLAWLGGGSLNSDSALSSTLSAGYSDSRSYSTNSRMNNVTVNMTNNATGVLSNQGAFEDYFGEQIKQLSKEISAELE